MPAALGSESDASETMPDSARTNPSPRILGSALAPMSGAAAAAAAAMEGVQIASDAPGVAATSVPLLQDALPTSPFLPLPSQAISATASPAVPPAQPLTTAPLQPPQRAAALPVTNSVSSLLSQAAARVTAVFSRASPASVRSESTGPTAGAGSQEMTVKTHAIGSEQLTSRPLSAPPRAADTVADLLSELSLQVSSAEAEALTASPSPASQPQSLQPPPAQFQYKSSHSVDEQQPQQATPALMPGAMLQATDDTDITEAEVCLFSSLFCLFLSSRLVLV